MIQLGDLPTEMLEHVFGFLCGNDLLHASETCSRFHKIISKSPQFVDKINFSIPFPCSTVDKNIILKSTRNYTNVTLVRIKKKKFCDDEILSKFGTTVTSLTLDWRAVTPRRNTINIWVRRQITNKFAEISNEQILDEMQVSNCNELKLVLSYFPFVKTMHLISVHLDLIWF
jgi:hypothetical protein